MSNKLNDTIDRLVEAKEERDVIIIQLVTEHAISIDKATKVYAAYAKEHGLTKAIVSHKEEALAWLADKYPMNEWTATAVKDATIDLTAVYAVAESTARDYCKAYSDSLGVALPVINPRDAIFNWFLVAGNSASKEDFIEYVVGELGRSKSNANEYWKGYELHQFLVGGAE